MPDISMCANKSCPNKEKCYRFIAEPNPYWQSYMDFKCDSSGECDNFISSDGSLRVREEYR